MNSILEAAKDFVVSTTAHAVGAPLGDAIYDVCACIVHTIKDEIKEHKRDRKR